MASEFVAEYRDLLAQLKRNEKRDINCLSMLAEDNRQHAPAIVDAIEQHILVAPGPVKLPALYVLDSIVKNVREPYTSLFSQRLPEVFGSVWDSTLPDKRASLGRLFATWTGVFGPDVLERVKVHMAAPGVPQLLPQQPQVLLQPQPVQVFQGGYTATGTGPAVVTLPPGAYVSAMPQPVVSLAPQPFGSGGGAPIQVQYLPPAQVQQYVAPPQAVAGLVPGMQPPPSPPHAGWQQSQPALDPRLRRRSPSPMIVGGWPGQQQQQQQQQPGVMPAQLSDLLSSLAQTGVLRGAPPAYNREDPVLRTTEMTPAYIKETHEGVIAALVEASAKTRGAFLDLAFLRKQRQRSGGASSRSWYVTIDHWLTGTVAATEAAAAFGGEEEEPATEELPALEPEDPAQPCCAISGEPFDKVYDQEKEGWFFKGARRLTPDEAAAHGVPGGSIVKVSALAEATHAPGDAAGAELDASGLAAEIAAAAAGAGAQGAQQEGGAGGAHGGGGAAQADAAGGVWHDDKKAAAGAADITLGGVKREAGAEEAPADAKRHRVQ